MGINWTIVIGLLAGVISKFLILDDKEPSEFVLTAMLGVVGALFATLLKQSLGWCRPGQGAGPIGPVIGAVTVVLVWAYFRRGGSRAERDIL